ncbi:MAG: rRNA maturation RNase YbeY [Anaerolineae bacterium]|nr:rRNA maturation RNase YbeY [Anaerolineae bacterium]
MTVDVQIAPALRRKVQKTEIRRWAEAVMRAEGLTELPDMAVVITDDETIQALNRDFRGVDEPTDVLAFGEEKPGPFVLAPGEPAYLGDIVISLERAEVQARERGVPAKAELQLLLVHGILHLLGYDHDTDEAQRHMWTRQDAILDMLKE